MSRDDFLRSIEEAVIHRRRGLRLHQVLKLVLWAGVLALLITGCGGADAPPSVASIKNCLQQAGAWLTPGTQHGATFDEVGALTKDGGTIIVLTFDSGSEGREAAEKLESTPTADGGARDLQTHNDGRLVLSLSNDPSSSDIGLAERCAGQG